MRLFFILIFSTSFFVNAQGLPSNPKPGYCYIRCFDYDKKVQWEEINCDSLKIAYVKTSFIIKGENKVDIIKNRLRFKSYKEKLINLGYNLKPDDCLSQQTIDAHHTYIKDKKKAYKKNQRNKKRKLKDSLKKLKLQNK
jgi:hypothetical protein